MEQERAFVKIALGDATSALTLSMIEADRQFPTPVEAALREKLPTVSLLDASIVIENNHCFAPRVFNEYLPALLPWLLQLDGEWATVIAR